MGNTCTFLTSKFLRKLFYLAALFVAACSSEPPDLKQAADYIQWEVAPRNLTRSAFAYAYPDCKPSQFVSFFFSALGAAERPVFDSEGIQQARAQRMPIVPDDVAIVPLEPKLSEKKQIVLRADAADEYLLIDEYLEPNDKPVATRKIKIKKVVADDMAASMAKGNMEMGVSAEMRH